MTRVFSSILIICQMTSLSTPMNWPIHTLFFFFTAEKAITQQFTAPCNLVIKHDHAESFESNQY